MISIDDKYVLRTQIGKGGSSEVYMAEEMETGDVYAMKFIKDLPELKNKKELKLLNRERDAMVEICDHPNILKSYKLQLKGVSDNDGDIKKDLKYHMMEYAENGTLMDYLKHGGVFSEMAVNFYFMQIFHAVQYIHEQGYAHLDLKLTNIMLDSYFNIKIGDFGSASKLDKFDYSNSKRGTPKFMAPEITNLKDYQRYNGKLADVYSLGVCMFLLLFREYPERAENECFSSESDQHSDS
jgi:serine/threonine protein kinase